MCGIAGMFGTTSEGCNHDAVLRVKKMVNAVSHRGPSATVQSFNNGALGHVQLEAGESVASVQPTVDAATGVAIAYNGEFYPSSGSPSNLEGSGAVAMLRGYLAKGSRFFHSVNSEFALALIDPRSRSLTLVRDRWGTKPLYYARRQGVVSFCSEVKGLYAAGVVERSLNPEHMMTSLLRVDTLASTPFHDVHAVPPGTVLTFTHDGRHRVEQFGDPGNMLDALADTCHDSVEVASETVEGLLRQAVRRRTDADCPPGAFLSGGLDSSLVAAMMAETAPSTLTYTSAFTDQRYDESHWARLVANATGLRNHTVAISPQDQAQYFSEALFHAEEFVQLTDGVAKMLLAQRAHQDARSILVGEGADEVFLGYPSHLRAAANEPAWAHLAARADTHTTQLGLDDVPFGPSSRITSNQERQTRLMESVIGDILGDAVRDQLDADATLRSYLRESGFTSSRSAVRAEQVSALRLTLPAYLFSYLGGKVEMSASVEGRYPFLDLDLVTYAFSLPVSTLLSGGEEKGILRRIASRLLPHEIVARPKHGFSAQVLPNALRDAVLAGSVEAMTPSRINDLGFFRASRVRALFASLRRPGRFGDTTRVSRERLAVFIVSVQMLHNMFVRPAVPSASGGDNG